MTILPSGFCTDISADPALVFVSGGYDTFVTLAQESYALAIDETNALNGFTVTPINSNVSFNFDGQLTPFQMPARPILPLEALTFMDPGTPGEPPAFVPEIPDGEDAPVFNEAAPVISIGAKPATPNVPAPVPPANPATPIFPVKPDYLLPEVPTFESLNLPTMQALLLPEFQGERPTLGDLELSQEWSFNPEAYSSQLMTDLQAKISLWLQGGTGLPPSIERALFARSIDRVEEGAARDIQTATEVHSSKGFTEPNGPLNTRVNEVVIANKQARNLKENELTIRFHEEELVNIRQALERGIALEGVTVDLHVKEQAMLLDAAKFLRETEIAVINVKVQAFNAQVTLYQADAQVLESLIRAELAKVEIYRAQLEGEKTKGELNLQRVQLYAEQLRGIEILAQFYKTQVEAVGVEVEANRQVILTYQAQVDGYGKRWDAFRSQLDAYRAEIEGQKVRGEIFESQTNAFATRVTAWDRTQQTRFDRERLRTQQHDQSLNVWKGLLELAQFNIQKETSRIASVAQTIDAQARIYQADAAVATAASAATDRSFELGLRKEESRTSVALKNGEININQAVQLAQLLLRSKETRAQVLGQLSASTMSAINFSAGLSSSRSKGESCSTSVNWSGEVADLE